MLFQIKLFLELFQLKILKLVKPREFHVFISGIIRNHLDTLVQSDTKVCGELYLPISFSLMSNSTVSNIKKVYSHAQGKKNDAWDVHL